MDTLAGMDTVYLEVRDKVKYTFQSLIDRTIDNIFVNNLNETEECIKVYCSQLNTSLGNSGNSTSVSPLFILHKKGFSRFNNPIPLGEIQNFELVVEPPQENPIHVSIEFN